MTPLGCFLFNALVVEQSINMLFDSNAPTMYSRSTLYPLGVQGFQSGWEVLGMENGA